MGNDIETNRDFLMYELELLTIRRPYWFIIRDYGSDTFYLKDYNSETNAALWTRNYEAATSFMNEERAEEYKRKFFDNRCPVMIVEHELDI